MNSNSKNDKDLQQIHLMSTREITWKIQNFKYLPRMDNYSLDSPPFDFENATWCLRLYTCYEESNMGFTIVRLSSRVPRYRLCFNLIWPGEYHGYHAKKAVFDEDTGKSGDIMLFDSHLIGTNRYTRGIDEIKTLTLACQISCYRPRVVNAFSQTEQDTKNIGDFCQNFKNLFLNGQDHDLVLKVEDKEFHAHRNILQARLPVLNSMFSSDVIGKRNAVIDIPDCNQAAFEQFMFYIYCGEVETLNAANMLALYYVADKHDVRYLKNRCREFIKNSLTFPNVSDAMSIALSCSDTDLLESTTEYFVRHVNEVLHTVEWQSFVKSNPIQANELFIKAAKNLESEKIFEPKNRKSNSDFDQIYLISTLEVTWKVRDFTSLPEAVHFLDSPPFLFMNATWCLRLYPHFQTTYVGFSIVRLGSRVPHHRFRYNLIWPAENHGHYSIEVDFDEDHTEDGDMTFIDRSLPIRYTSGLDKTSVLELMCQISSYGSPTASAFSQTEQEAESIGDLCRNFKNLLLNGRDHDLVLKVKDKEFNAHQNILRARSPVLESMLSHDMIEKNSGEIDIPDCDPGAFEQFLLYLYGGEVETLNTENVLALYYIADKYEVRHLKEKCREFIEESLTYLDCSDVLELALNHSDAVLLKCATDYFVENVQVVLRTEGWQSFVKRYPIKANELFIEAASKWDDENSGVFSSSVDNLRGAYRGARMRRPLSFRFFSPRPRKKQP